MKQNRDRKKCTEGEGGETEREGKKIGKRERERLGWYDGQSS